MSLKSKKNKKLKDFKNFCERCPKRNTCIELCVAVETYAGQDYVPQKEILVPDIEKVVGISWEDLIPIRENILDVHAWIDLVYHIKMTKKQKKYLYLNCWKKQSKAKIAKRFNTSRQNVSQIIKRIKIKRRKNNGR